ncbi:MAG: hypothetical protein Q8Q38_01155 [bacterium]|nr:hypothetical protein [bacterium]MDZ4231634.1 hypothetical protein [Candidatus Pacearchaeota archaeon]
MLAVLTTTFLFLLLIVAFYVVYRVVAWRARLRREVHEAEGVLHATFDALREDMAERLSSLRGLRGREAEEEQRRVQKDMEENLKVAERFARKEIEDVQKELDGT